MKYLRKAWNNFKTQPEIWFFYGFLLTSMLSIRKVVTNHLIAGSFNEYSGTYIYLSDLFLFAMWVSWLISILYNKNIILSIIRLKNVSRRTFLILLAPLLLVTWSFISIKWANAPQIALYRSFKLFEFYLFFLFLVINRKCFTWNIIKNVFKIVIFIGVINSLIGILQFILRHSLGLFWLKESLISPEIPGVAKIILSSEKYIRAYGLFPHPNILGGFLLISIILTFTYKKIFTGNNNVSRTAYKTKMFHGEHFSFLGNGVFLSIALWIQIAGEILTFSKSAILSLILAIVYIFRNSLVPRGTFKKVIGRQTKFGRIHQIRNMEGKPLILKKAFFLIIIMFLLIYLVQLDFGAILINSFKERLFYLDIAKNIIFSNFFSGIGAGQFVLGMQSYSSQVILNWQFQPVHNVFLLILAELGLVGVSIFLWFVWKVFHMKQSEKKTKTECSTWNETRCEAYSQRSSENVPPGTIELQSNLTPIFKAILIGFFMISLFDHYLWDIQQGQIMLWLALGLLVGAAD
jgi:hypothetical protein